ncbi:MAG TPA: alpha/beta hydrolase [Steroidobacteraceae bacterium]|nr:alpha/beta hydrolase [Steroidobacteraceae bacterium]
MSPLRSLAAACVALMLSGCVSSLLARKVVAPPNKSGIKALFEDSVIIRNAPLAFTDVWKVHAGPPPADIVVASIEPGDYGFAYDLELSYPEGRSPKIDHFSAFWRAAKDAVPSPVASKGTLLFLHGYLQDKRFLTPWALRLAQAGYRCALLDLRGHGDSTGRHISFGAFEAADVSAVIDDLARRGWDVSRVGLFGVSYGASVGLLTAGRDTRVQSVVAFEPFSSAEKAVPELMRSAFAAEARGITDDQFAAAYRKESALAGFAWADADIFAALRRTRAPVLFLHGEADTWLSPGHSRALFDQAPPGSRLELVPRDNHVTLPLQIAPFEAEVIGWFDAAFTKR